MKKSALVKMAALLMICLTTTVSAASSSNTVRLDVAPATAVTQTYIKDGYTMAPLRLISEQLGCTVGYNQSTNSATVEKNGVVIEVPIGKSMATINGAPSKLGTVAELKDGSTMIPLRFIVETLGGTLSFNETTKEVIINTSNMRDIKIPTAPTTPVAVGDVDIWGNAKRTSDLPKDHYMFPYIREDVPNWVYNKIGLAMNNNMYGPWASQEYKGKRFVATAPKDLFYEAGSGQDMWLSKFAASSPISGESLPNQEFYKTFSQFLDMYLNVDYRNIDESKYIKWSKILFSHFTVPDPRGVRDTQFENDITRETKASLTSIKENQKIVSTEITPLYELTWRSTDWDKQTINVPIQVKISFEKWPDPSDDLMFGGTNFSGSSDKIFETDFSRVGTLEAVLHVKLVKHNDFYKIDYMSFDPLSQIDPTKNFLDGLKDEYKDMTKQRNNFSYRWTRFSDDMGALVLSRYEEFDPYIASYSTKRDKVTGSVAVFYTYKDLTDNGKIDNPIVHKK